MARVQAKRRLVKSPPELWSELSDAAALARHLGEFGEIRITRLEPESKVVWEGDRANGSVELDAAGWGTQVVLTVEVEEPEPVEPEPEPVAAEPEPEPVAVEPEPVVVEPEPEPEPEPVAGEPEPEPEPEPQPVTVEPEPVAVEPEPEPAPDPLVAEERRRGFFARLFGWKDHRVESVMASARETVATEPEPEPLAVEPEPEPLAVAPEPEPEPEPDPAAAEPEQRATSNEQRDEQQLLEHVLDQLGQAHHRPFSRA